MLDVGRSGPGAGGEEVLDLGEGLVVDQRLVNDLVGDNPFVPSVPPQGGGIAEGDILDVDEGLVLALLVPF